MYFVTHVVMSLSSNGTFKSCSKKAIVIYWSWTMLPAAFTTKGHQKLFKVIDIVLCVNTVNVYDHVIDYLVSNYILVFNINKTDYLSKSRIKLVVWTAPRLSQIYFWNFSTKLFSLLSVWVDSGIRVIQRFRDYDSWKILNNHHLMNNLFLTVWLNLLQAWSGVIFCVKNI